MENTNRWIRVFITKKSDISLYSDDDVLWIENWFNHTPKQCLDGATTYETFMEKEFDKKEISIEINPPVFRILG
ncbi:MAG: hypothetical protein QMD86_01445 [Patescibacteria group bacterium]|nr:hypothetical protein [Patescibacteria group bacterium]